MRTCSLSAYPASTASLNNSCERVDIRRCTVINANYEKVITTLARLLSDERFANVCRCVKCLNDIAVLALNCLPPHYYVDAGRGGEIGSPSVMVESAVIEAIERVMENPG